MSKVAIIGSPNSGKSLLFNKLTGLNHKVANFPGITVAVGSGTALHDSETELVDFPGVYSLNTLTGEERLAVETFQRALEDDTYQAVICVLDATRLEKGLFFALQVLESCIQHGKPLIIAANMQDVIEHHKMQFDAAGLTAALDTPVIAVSAKSGAGLTELMAAIATSKVATAGALIAADDAAHHNRSRELAREYGPRGDLLIRTQTRLDKIFLHSWFGGVSFFLIMLTLFQSIFTWAAPVMDGVESLLSGLEGLVLPLLGDGAFADFVSNALFGGLGAFLVFVPQIFVLTLVVGFLEDTGYLARAAVICHRPLRFFGLTGKSFVPMLSGVACAIPGIYAARTVESPRKRWLTYMAIPLMPCSARLPVYGLLIAAFIPATGGIIGAQGIAMFGIYLFGIITGLLVTALVSRVDAGEQDDLPFVLEMPPYRMPGAIPLLRSAWDRSKHFVTKAGPVIFMVTLVVWVLGYLPNGGTDLATSYLGTIGHWIEPVFEPIGLDWKYGVAILTAFLAREVFVGTLGTLFGLENADENIISLAEHVQSSGLTTGSAVALLVFFAIALQCVSTMAILSKESGSWRLPMQLLVAYMLLAYALAWIAFQIVNLITG